MYLVIHAYDCHERNVQSPRRRKRCEEGCRFTHHSTQERRFRALDELVDTTPTRSDAIDAIAESTVYRYSPHEAVCKKNSRSSGLLPPLSVRTDRRGAVNVYTHTCVMRLTPEPPMSHALTLAAGTRTKEYSSILDYDQRADQPPTSIQVPAERIHGVLARSGQTHGRAPLTNTCAATPSLPLIRKKASLTSCGSVPAPPPAVSIAPSNLDSIWSATTGARRSSA